MLLQGALCHCERSAAISPFASVVIARSEATKQSRLLRPLSLREAKRRSNPALCVRCHCKRSAAISPFASVVIARSEATKQSRPFFLGIATARVFLALRNDSTPPTILVYKGELFCAFRRPCCHCEGVALPAAISPFASVVIARSEATKQSRPLRPLSLREAKRRSNLALSFLGLPQRAFPLRFAMTVPPHLSL